MAASLSIVKPPWQLDCFPGYCGPASDPETQNRAPASSNPGPCGLYRAGSTLRTPGQCLRGLGTCNAGPLHVPAAALLGRRPSPGPGPHPRGTRGAGQVALTRARPSCGIRSAGQAALTWAWRCWAGRPHPGLAPPAALTVAFIPLSCRLRGWGTPSTHPLVMCMETEQQNPWC